MLPSLTGQARGPKPIYRVGAVASPRHRARATGYTARTYQQGRRVALALVANERDQTDYTRAVKAGLIYGLAWVFASTAGGLGFLQF